MSESTRPPIDTNSKWLECSARIDHGERSVTISLANNIISFAYDAFNAFHMQEGSNLYYSINMFMDCKSLEVMPIIVSILQTGPSELGIKLGQVVHPRLKFVVENEKLTYTTATSDEFKIIHHPSTQLLDLAIERFQPKYEQWLLETHLLGSDTNVDTSEEKV